MSLLKLRLVSLRVMKGSNKTDIKKLDNLPDSAIDYSDIPETDADFWKEAEVEYPSRKIALSIRLDEDIIE
jgi:uncharacterized protein (DUF4415 family)